MCFLPGALCLCCGGWCVAATSAGGSLEGWPHVSVTVRRSRHATDRMSLPVCLCIRCARPMTAAAACFVVMRSALLAWDSELGKSRRDLEGEARLGLRMRESTQTA